MHIYEWLGEEFVLHFTQRNIFLSGDFQDYCNIQCSVVQKPN